MPAPEEREPPQPVADPEALAKALEIELILKRSSWQKTQARRGTWRALSFLFLFLVILGALFAWFYVMPSLTRSGPERPGTKASDSGR
jgi:cell division septal protein FtsQ